MSPHKQEDEDYEDDQHGPFPEKVLNKNLSEALQSGVLIEVKLRIKGFNLVYYSHQFEAFRCAGKPLTQRRATKRYT